MANNDGILRGRPSKVMTATEAMARRHEAALASLNRLERTFEEYFEMLDRRLVEMSEEVREIRRQYLAEKESR